METPGRAFAATWRDERGETVGTTYGGTMCLFPVKPWRIRIAREGFEHIVRCRECPGCLEFDRRRLAERLNVKYGGGSAHAVECTIHRTRKDAHGAAKHAIALFLVRIWAPIDQHASICHRLHRRRGLELEPGMYRLGASSFALLSRESSSLRSLLRDGGVRFRIEPVRLSRGRRAWRLLTAGMIVAREIYGEQRNRFYSRGLPPAEREKWEVQKIGAYRSYDRYRAPRAWRGRRVVLVPPDVWKLSRTDRRALRGLLCRQPDPEGVQRVMGLVADFLGKSGGALSVIAPPKAVLSRDQVVRWYREMAERKAGRTFAPAPASALTPSSGEGGYTSSVHKQGELMPEELARMRRKDDTEARKRRAIRESMEIIERMKTKSEERG